MTPTPEKTPTKLDHATKTERATPPKIVTIATPDELPHIERNRKELEDEAAYQTAMTTLNDSFLLKPPFKPVTRRTSLHHKVRWDGQGKTFMLFKKQYEAHLIASQQDYATDPEFRVAYIAQDKSFDILCRQYEASKAQIASDTKQQYGALAMACSGNDEGQRFLGLYPRDGIRVWHEMVHWFQYGGSVETILGELESNLQTDYTEWYL
jgi:hypothetical protein